MTSRRLSSFLSGIIRHILVFALAVAVTPNVSAAAVFKSSPRSAATHHGAGADGAREAYTVDFGVLEAAQTGTSVPVTLRHTPTSRPWDYSAQIQEAAPAIWAEGGLAQGQAVAQSAETTTRRSGRSPPPRRTGRAG